MPTSQASTADLLLDAQVAWIIDQLTGPDLPAMIEQDLDALLAAGANLPLGKLIDAAEIKAAAKVIAETVPPSSAATTLVEMAAEVIHEGPGQTYTLNQIIDREHVAALTDVALDNIGLVEDVLDELANSPLMATMASRFVGRLVGEVLSANKAIADKIPGVGGIVSLGANAAGKVTGVANKQIEALVGGTAGKGAAIATRRLNKIVIDTLKDPTTRDAVLEVYDLYADEPLPAPKDSVGLDDAKRIAGLIQDIAINGAASEPATALVDALIDGFFGIYGEHPVSTLLDELDLTRDVLLERAQAAIPGALSAAHEAGELEPLIRQRLAPFFDSPAVTEILGS